MLAKLIGATALLVALFVCPRSELQAMPVKDGPVRTLILNDDINKASAEAIERLRINAVQLDTETTVPVFIMSPGGSVRAMTFIVNEMKLMQKLGYRFDCLAVQALSAAFIIWLQCDKRSVLPNSQMMFHYPWIGWSAPITLEEAERMTRSLQQSRVRFDTIFKERLEPYMSWLEIEKSATDSRFYTGEELCAPRPEFCRVVNVVRNYNVSK